MSNIFKEVIVSTGEYQTPDGQTKQRWAKCGIVIQKPNGSLSMKLDLFPQWFVLSDPKPRDEKPQAKSSIGFDDDLPPF